MNDMSIIQVISQREISEILHFTTNNGLVGVLHTGRLSANAFLKEEQQLEHILKINSFDRSRDAMWLEYINLSISRINDYFFNYSRKQLKHQHAYWCILSFDPMVMAHPGVRFATTNNAYPYTKRDPGVEGLEALFAKHIPRKPGWSASRLLGEASSNPTCRQAEALYHGHLSLEHLRAIYVETGQEYDEVSAQVAMLAPHLLAQIDISIEPGKFI